jgi:hypothetical protein
MSLTIMTASSTNRLVVTMLRIRDGPIRRGSGRAEDDMIYASSGGVRDETN